MPHSQTILTARGLRLIEDLLHHDDMDLRVAAMLRGKIAAATIMLPEDVANDVVTLDSRVQFTVAGRRDERRLISSLSREVRGQSLLVRTPLGATLLGMRTGHSASIAYPDGSSAEVSVISVPYQPEAIRNDGRPAPTLRVVTTTGSAEPKRRNTWPGPGDDGPGPFAA